MTETKTVNFNPKEDLLTVDLLDPEVRFQIGRRKRLYRLGYTSRSKCYSDSNRVLLRFMPATGRPSPCDDVRVTEEGALSFIEVPEDAIPANGYTAEPITEQIAVIFREKIEAYDRYVAKYGPYDEEQFYSMVHPSSSPPGVTNVLRGIDLEQFKECLEILPPMIMNQHAIPPSSREENTTINRYSYDILTVENSHLDWKDLPGERQIEFGEVYESEVEEIAKKVFKSCSPLGEKGLNFGLFRMNYGMLGGDGGDSDPDSPDINDTIWGESPTLRDEYMRGAVDWITRKRECRAVEAYLSEYPDEAAKVLEEKVAQINRERLKAHAEAEVKLAAEMDGVFAETKAAFPDFPDDLIWGFIKKRRVEHISQVALYLTPDELQAAGIKVPRAIYWG